MNNPLFRTLAMCLMYPIFNYCQQLWCGAYLLFTGVGHCQLNLSQLYLDLVLHSFICRKGRCQKHPEGGGAARPLAVTMSPPHFFGHPTTLPPFFWSPIYPPPIFLVTHLPSPHFFGHPSTPNAQWSADQSWGVQITHLTTETGFYILQAYIISLDSKWEMPKKFSLADFSWSTIHKYMTQI